MFVGLIENAFYFIFQNRMSHTDANDIPQFMGRDSKLIENIENN